MNTFEKIIFFLAARGNTPRAFGIFHISFIAAVIAICILAVRFRKIFTEKAINRMLLAVGITMTVMEIYKQLVISFNIDGTWSYKWLIFPFQFCSTPIYITLLAYAFSFAKNKTVYSALCAFLSSYALIAGTVVFLFPSSVFSPIIGVNLQTMIHHGLMIILAVVLLASGRITFEKRTIIGAFSVFMPLLVIAMIMNAVYGNGALFDMFYLAPDSTFVLAILRSYLGGFPPYPVYLIGYTVLFTVGAVLVIFVSHKIRHSYTKKMLSE